MYKRNLSITKSGVKIPIKSLVHTVPHYPKQGAMFRDITTMLKDPIGLHITIDELVRRYKDVKIDMMREHRIVRFHHRRIVGLCAVLI